MMHILAEVTWWLLLALGCSVTVVSIVLVAKKIRGNYGLNQAEDDQADLVEMVKKFGTLVEDKYQETKSRYSYDEDEIKMIIDKISNRVPDEV